MPNFSFTSCNALLLHIFQISRQNYQSVTCCVKFLYINIFTNLAHYSFMLEFHVAQISLVSNDRFCTDFIELHYIEIPTLICVLLGNNLQMIKLLIKKIFTLNESHNAVYLHLREILKFFERMQLFSQTPCWTVGTALLDYQLSTLATTSENCTFGYGFKLRQ